MLSRITNDQILKIFLFLILLQAKEDLSKSRFNILIIISNVNTNYYYINNIRFKE